MCKRVCRGAAVMAIAFASLIATGCQPDHSSDRPYSLTGRSNWNYGEEVEANNARARGSYDSSPHYHPDARDDRR